MTIDKNTRITIGTALALAGAIFARDIWVRDQITSLKQAVHQVMTIEDGQNWTDEFRRLNPNIQTPNIYDILRKRRQDAAVAPFEMKGTL